MLRAFPTTPPQSSAPYPTIAPQQTQALVNNQMALGAQQAAQKSMAGAGLSRGRGQRAMDANRAGVARADAEDAAASTRMQDSQDNENMQAQYGLMKSNEKLQYDSLAEQARMSQWDSRFNNMTTAWGVLAGLLR